MVVLLTLRADYSLLALKSATSSPYLPAITRLDVYPIFNHLFERQSGLLDEV